MKNEKFDTMVNQIASETQIAVLLSLKNLIKSFETSEFSNQPGLTWEQLYFLIDHYSKKNPNVSIIDNSEIQ